MQYCFTRVHATFRIRLFRSHFLEQPFIPLLIASAAAADVCLLFGKFVFSPHNFLLTKNNSSPGAATKINNNHNSSRINSDENLQKENEIKCEEYSKLV